MSFLFAPRLETKQYKHNQTCQNLMKKTNKQTNEKAKKYNRYTRINKWIKCCKISTEQPIAVCKRYYIEIYRYWFFVHVT